MKNFLKLIILVGLVFSPINAFARIKVVATLPSLGALAKAIGGDQVKIKTLARGNQDAHFMEAKPSYVVALNRADLFILNGMELERAWLNPVLLQSRNPKIQIGKAGYLDASLVINPLETPTGRMDRSMGDVHPLGNPHYLLDARNHLKIAALISQRLGQLDPANSTLYEKNLALVNQRLRPKINQWQSRIRNKTQANPQLITFHKTFTYLANWLGFNVIANVEPLPGIPPNARHTKKLVNLITEKKVPLLLMASYYPKKVPEYLNSKTGIKIVISPVDASTPDLDSVVEFFDSLIKKLESNL